jgi:hypothetical protein
MGKSTISMAIFNSYVKLPEGTSNMPCQVSGIFKKKSPAKFVSKFLFGEWVPFWP